jgi:hypothetical protein
VKRLIQFAFVVVGLLVAGTQPVQAIDPVARVTYTYKVPGETTSTPASIERESCISGGGGACTKTTFTYDKAKSNDKQYIFNNSKNSDTITVPSTDTGTASYKSGSSPGTAVTIGNKAAFDNYVKQPANTPSPATASPTLGTVDSPTECNNGGVKVSVGFGGIGGSSGGNCIGSKDQNPILAYVREMIRLFSALFGLAMVLVIMVSGFQYMTSQGESGKVEKAKNHIFSAVIAIICYFLLVAIANYLLPGGVFT